VVVVVVVEAVVVVTNSVVVVVSASSVVSVISGSELVVTSDTFDVSVAYCEADCTPQPATTTIEKHAAIFASFTHLTLVASGAQKSEAH
jgi:hypothetical protein